MTPIGWVAWLICGIYATIPSFWLAIHPFANRWRGVRRRYSLIAPMWMAMWVVAWAATEPWAHIALYRSPWAWGVTLTCFYVSYRMYSGGIQGMSLALIIGKPEFEPNRQQHLITHGVHGMVRHPLYLGHLCTMLGWSIGSGSLACLVLTAFAIVTGAIMIPIEERELRQRFGSEYDRYAERVPMILPKLF